MTKPVTRDPRQPAALDRDAGEAIRRLRTDRGLSRRALGAASGVSAQEIAKYEDGRNRVCLSRAHALAAALGADVAEIVGHVSTADAADADPAARAAELMQLALDMDPATQAHLLAIARALVRSG